MKSFAWSVWNKSEDLVIQYDYLNGTITTEITRHFFEDSRVRKYLFQDSPKCLWLKKGGDFSSSGEDFISLSEVLKLVGRSITKLRLFLPDDLTLALEVFDQIRRLDKLKFIYLEVQDPTILHLFVVKYILGCHDSEIVEPFDFDLDSDWKDILSLMSGFQNWFPRLEWFHSKTEIENRKFYQLLTKVNLTSYEMDKNHYIDDMTRIKQIHTSRESQLVQEEEPRSLMMTLKPNCFEHFPFFYLHEFENWNALMSQWNRIPHLDHVLTDDTIDQEIQVDFHHLQSYRGRVNHLYYLATRAVPHKTVALKLYPNVDHLHLYFLNDLVYLKTPQKGEFHRYFAKVQSINIYLRYRRFNTKIIEFFDQFLENSVTKTLHPVMEEEDLFLPDIKSKKKYFFLEWRSNLTEKELLERGWKMAPPKTIVDLWYSLGSTMNLTRPFFTSTLYKINHC